MGDSAARPAQGSDVAHTHSNNRPPSHKTALPEDAYGSVINEQSSGAPYIVANGVSMHEVSHSEAAGWDIRAPGDDSYGKGELIVVDVAFSEPVQADSNVTIRIRMGAVNRGLVPVDTRGNTVLFGALIRPQDRDRNGIWIGDNTETFDHNNADSIRSTGNSPGNADWSHASLGAQSDHKVDGSVTRPRLQNVKISSTPQHSDFYVRGETVQVPARFDRAVVVSGDISVRLNVEALQETVSRDADYSEGSGTSTLVFERVVTPFENDNDGMVIPRNALANHGDLALGTLAGGSIRGQEGGLLADLESRKRGR